jgi:hypothetical protein
VPGATAAPPEPALNHGFWLPLIGHLFLLAVALNPAWSIPPWPLFGALAVVTLAMSVAALASRQVLFHALATVATAVVFSTWRLRAQPEGWATVSLAAFAALVAYALASIRVARRAPGQTAVAAAAVLVLAELNTISSTLDAVSAPPLALTLAAHAIAFALLLALTWEFEWPGIASVSAGLAALALGGAAVARDRAWPALLLHAVVIYAPFALYPLIAGAGRATRDPYIAALIVAAASLLAGRQGMIDGGYQWMVGAVPVVIGLVTTVHLRQLLRLEPAGARDMGRLALVGSGGPRVPHRRHPDAARASMDHDRLGARRRGAGLALYARPAPRAALWLAGAAGRRLRAPRAQSGSVSLRTARRDADRQLVPLHLPAGRGRHGAGRLVVLARRRRLAPRFHGRGTCCLARQWWCCSSSSTSRSPTSTRPVPRSCSGSA